MQVSSAIELPPIKQVLIVYNPYSGRGKGDALAAVLFDQLRAEGFEVDCQESKKEYQDDEHFSRLMSNAQAVVVVGGDGTLSALLPLLAKYQRAVYMVPAGNESLFANAFGMTAEPQRVIAFLRNSCAEEHYWAWGNATPFFHMASCGFDADVVREVARIRKGQVSNLTYFCASMRCFVRHTMPCLSLSVDGQEVLSKELGYLVVANSKHYARGLCPVPEADTCVPQLVARFFPHPSICQMLGWAWSFLMKQEMSTDKGRVFRGTQLQVNQHSPPSGTFQADGEALEATVLDARLDEKPVVVLSLASSK